MGWHREKEATEQHQSCLCSTPTWELSIPPKGQKRYVKLYHPKQGMLLIRSSMNIFVTPLFHEDNGLKSSNSSEIYNRTWTEQLAESISDHCEVCIVNIIETKLKTFMLLRVTLAYSQMPREQGEAWRLYIQQEYPEGGRVLIFGRHFTSKLSTVISSWIRKHRIIELKSLWGTIYYEEKDRKLQCLPNLNNMYFVSLHQLCNVCQDRWLPSLLILLKLTS